MILYASLILSSKSECFVKELPENVKMTDLKFGYNKAELMQFFDALSDAGKECYRKMMLKWDSLFPLIYGSMYIFWLSLIYKRAGKNRKPVAFINLWPIIPMLFDWFENAWNIRMLGEYSITGNIGHFKLSLGIFINVMKWIVSSLNYLLIILGIILLLIKNKKT
jgi:hypothetical protein